MTTNSEAHKVVIKVEGIEFVKTVQQLTNVTLACDDDKLLYRLVQGSFRENFF